MASHRLASADWPGGASQARCPANNLSRLITSARCRRAGIGFWTSRIYYSQVSAREARRYGGQQGVLLGEQRVCISSGPGQPDRKVVAEPPQLILPATSTKPQRHVGQVGGS